MKSKCSGAWRSLMPGDGGCEQGEAPFTAHPTVSITVELMVSLLGYSDSRWRSVFTVRAAIRSSP